MKEKIRGKEHKQIRLPQSSDRVAGLTVFYREARSDRNWPRRDTVGGCSVLLHTCHRYGGRPWESEWRTYGRSFVPNRFNWQSEIDQQSDRRFASRGALRWDRILLVSNKNRRYLLRKHRTFEKLNSRISTGVFRIPPWTAENNWLIGSNRRIG